MSGALARTAFRLAAIEALRVDPVIAAGCGNRVYDSLVGAFEAGEPVPVVVVSTEDDNGEAYSANDGGPPFDQAVDVTFEITICSVVTDSTDVDIFVPVTDREMEAALDLLEFSAVRAVTVAGTPQTRLLRDRVTRRVTRMRSVRYTSEDTGTKLARRLVTLTVELQGDAPADPFAPPPAPGTPEAAFALLPDPLRTVALSLPAGSSGSDTCLDLVAKMTPAPPPSSPSSPAAAAAPTPVGAWLWFAPQRLRADTPPDPVSPIVPTFAADLDIPGTDPCPSSTAAS